MIDIPANLRKKIIQKIVDKLSEQNIHAMDAALFDSLESWEKQESPWQIVLIDVYDLLAFFYDTGYGHLGIYNVLTNEIATGKQLVTFDDYLYVDKDYFGTAKSIYRGI